MGKITKKVFADYIECDRQLFLEVGENDPNWRQPLIQANNQQWYNRIQSKI